MENIDNFITGTLISFVFVINSKRKQPAKIDQTKLRLLVKQVSFLKPYIF